MWKNRWKRPLAGVCLLLIPALFLTEKPVKPPPPSYEIWEGTGRVYEKTPPCEDGEGGSVLLALPEGKALCYLKAGERLPETGSTVRIKGRLKNFQKASNPGQFDAQAYYGLLQISFQLVQAEIQETSHSYNRIKEGLFLLREHWGKAFEACLPPLEASVMKTMLLGDKKAVEGEIKELYQRNGIAHVLAISGLHISLLGMLLHKGLKWLGAPRFLQTGLPAFVLFFYGLLTGFSVSAVRAVMMFGIHMAALCCKRTYDLVTAASLCAFLILAGNPFFLRQSGFLFSFGCIYAIGLLAPALTKKGSPFAGMQSGAAVTIGVLPVQLACFYQFPLYGILVNLVVIPLMSLLVPAGFLLIFCWSLGEGLVPVLSGISAFITGALSVYERICLLAESLPFSQFLTGKPALWQNLLFYGLLWIAVRFQRELSCVRKWGLVLLAVLALCLPGRASLKETALTFLDVGQGDCIHIENRMGEHYLVDGGSSSKAGVGKYTIMPYLKYKGIGTLEGVFVTHADQDHYNGILELLTQGKKQGITVKRLVLPDIGEALRTEGYRKLEQSAGEAGAEVLYLSAGQSLQRGDMGFFCLHPKKGCEEGDTNSSSLTLLLRQGAFTALLTGDVEGEGEEELQDYMERLAGRNGSFPVTVLKVAHHGARGSTSEEFLETVRPKIGVISAGEKNAYGHPHAETLKRLKEAGCLIYETKNKGAVTVRVRRNKIRVECFLEEERRGLLNRG